MRACNMRIPGSQNICTRDAGHAGEHRCSAADVDARKAAWPRASWFIVREFDGWYVMDLNNYRELAGPFLEHAEAVANADTRAYRVAQGWAP